MVSPGIGVGMNGSTIAESSELMGRYQSTLDRRKDSYEIEQLLQPILEVEGDVLAPGNPAGKNFSDLRAPFSSFLPFPFRIVRLIA